MQLCRDDELTGGVFGNGKFSGQHVGETDEGVACDFNLRRDGLLPVSYFHY